MERKKNNSTWSEGRTSASRVSPKTLAEFFCEVCARCLITSVGTRMRQAVCGRRKQLRTSGEKRNKRTRPHHFGAGGGNNVSERRRAVQRFLLLESAVQAVVGEEEDGG